MPVIFLSVAAAIVALGCGSSDSGPMIDGSGGSGGDQGSAFVATLEHTFDPIPVEPVAIDEAPLAAFDRRNLTAKLAAVLERAARGQAP